jgi:hypothetical protein
VQERLFDGLSAGGSCSGCKCDTECDAVQPTDNRGAPADRAGAPSQRQKGSLERILGFVHIAHDSAASVQHHSAVPPHQQFKRGLVALLHEAAQQLAVADILAAAGRQDAPQARENAWKSCLGHGYRPSMFVPLL